MHVPFLDLKAQYRTINTEVDEAITKVISNAAFSLGPAVREFEVAFADYIGVKNCVAVNSGTAAIQVALTAAGIGEGDEVIVPASTFFATAEAVCTAGAKPVLVDVDPISSNLDPEKLEGAITQQTRAVIPVHLYGQSADLGPIVDIADSKNLTVIEDAAQAHGSLYRGRRVGSIGDAACFSFYPGKNLGAYGEGGAIVTSDDDIALKARMLRDHGSREKYRHEFIGYNFRLDGIQGAVLNVKLKRLDGWNDRRRAHAAAYGDLLAGSGIQLPVELDYGRHVYHLYVVRVTDRDKVRSELASAGIETGIHYPLPLHLQPALAHLGYKQGDFPVTEALAAECLSLPMYPELERDQIHYVAETLRNVCGTTQTAAAGDRGLR